MTTTPSVTDLERLIEDAERLGVTSAMLDGEVLSTFAGEVHETDPVARKRAEEDASWSAMEVNASGVAAQLEYLLGRHEYRWLHDLMVDATR